MTPMNDLAQHHNVAESIALIRKKFNIGRTEFANLLGIGSVGERTVRGWEQGEHLPSKRKLEDIGLLEERLVDARRNAPFSQPRSSFKFIDLFAGIGGIRLPFQQLGGECVFTSEWDKFAQKTYLANFGEVPSGDITQIKASDIPDHDILLAGFPCQAFSQAGHKKGFSDTRGTMFFEIQRILVEKRPRAFLLENVKQLRGHDKGRTLHTILDILKGEHVQSVPDDIPMSTDARHALGDKLNYWVDYRVLRAADFGVPQNRERVFIVGFDKDYYGEHVDFSELFNWPAPSNSPTRVGNILESISQVTNGKDIYTISDKLWAGHQRRKSDHKLKGNGFGYSVVDSDTEYTNTISARYYKDGSEILVDQSKLGKNPRKLTSRECARLQGFPENFVVDAVSQGQVYKQFGNSVCVKVVEAVANQMILAMEKASVELNSVSIE
jgi:DNA (cytosine-5)-methyltransferase 1